MKKELTIDSKIENLRTVEKLIDDVAANNEISSESYGNILIAILEGVNNAILHGNKNDEKKKVNLSFDINKDELKVMIQDQGDGFDYENIPDPTAPENIENINGRGIFLMEKLSDQIEFFEKGTRVELTFKI